MKIKVPHVFIFLSIIILFCAILTYFVPSGAYQRTTRKFGKIEQTVLVPGSYRELPKTISLKGLLLNEKVKGEASPVSLLDLLTAIPKGMLQSAALIFFVFIAGAIFNIVIYTKTINAILFFLIQKFRQRPTILFFLIYLSISAASAILGLAVELIPLIPVFLVLSKEFGYDRMFGLALIALPAFIGWSTAITNPFNVTIAQQIAELPLGSGMVFRFFLFMLFLVIGFSYLMYYGKRVKQNKIASLAPGNSYTKSEKLKIEEQKLTSRHLWILFVLIFGYAIIMLCVQTIGWGLIEMTGGFIGIGILVILISGLSGDQAMETFVKGLEKMIIPALIIGFARGISVVMQESQIIDTILNHASNNLMLMPKSMAGSGMLVFQSTLNFFIPSASGQALVSMPIMTPLSDLIGITRQTGVLAFVLGDGLSNIIIPTNGVLMAMIGFASIPFGKWLKFILPLFIILFSCGILSILLAIWMGY
ncbi:hypothetical protein OO013_16365 [Mangrovivirga sp. M17]|uniref:YfcC family protein n=1 Tax=Mangrovivirga halotolerans TaxID=2993936 RepID=A0ABT3RUZ6_9BACT|nr:Na+/H+ antiporter NhaC family protein [Mangrovivirga halotolerans]MCX2745455.1 hypothetical protein [Mangrovivirga halotolerans]